jgi:molybdopterin-guanine dinucleotide biosynthesis protein A
MFKAVFPSAAPPIFGRPPAKGWTNYQTRDWQQLLFLRFWPQARLKGVKKRAKRPSRLEVCILAGGLSRRMGRDKTKLRLGRRSMLGQIRATARATGLPVRVIRRDAVPRCGPLGGIYTALKTTRAKAVLFLACDMPLITVRVLNRLRRELKRSKRNVVLKVGNKIGFPLMLRPASLPIVSGQLAGRDRSIRCLAKTLNARVFRAPRSWSALLRNVNTPAEWAEVRKLWLPRR